MNCILNLLNCMLCRMWIVFFWFFFLMCYITWNSIYYISHTNNYRQSRLLCGPVEHKPKDYLSAYKSFISFKWNTLLYLWNKYASLICSSLEQLFLCPSEDILTLAWKQAECNDYICVEIKRICWLAKCCCEEKIIFL